MKPEDIERRFSGGQCIVDRGAEGDELFVISSGNVLLDLREGDAPRLLSEGDIFGESAAILGQPYGFRAEAHGDVTLLAIDPPLLNRLCKENADFSFRLMRHLATQTVALGVPAAATADLSPEDANLSALARAVHGRRREGESPMMIQGNLCELAEDSGLSMLETYYCLHELLAQHVLCLVDDQLTVMEPDEIERLRAG